MDGSALALSSPDTLSLSLSEMEGAPCQVTTYSEYDNVTSDDNTGEPWPPGQQEGGAGEDTGPGAGTQVTGQLQVRVENIIDIIFELKSDIKSSARISNHNEWNWAEIWQFGS